MSDWNLFLVIILVPICVLGTGIYVGMESMAPKRAPLSAYPAFFGASFILLFLLFGDHSLLTPSQI